MSTSLEMVLCEVSFEEVKESLLKLEKQLALEYNLTGSEEYIRDQIYYLFKYNVIPETEMIIDWMEWLDIYNHYLKGTSKVYKYDD